MEQIEHEFTYKEFIRVMQVMSRNNPREKRTRIFFIVILGYFILSAGAYPAELFPKVMILFSLYIIFLPHLIPFLMTRKRYLKQQQILGKTLISFDDDSISVKTKALDSTHRWIDHFIVVNDVLLIYPTVKRDLAHVIIKGWCKDESQFNRIVELAKKLKEIKL